MEVHKHPHHVTHKKKWTEYLLEFFMLFLAVFLGFLAEYQLEHKIEKDKEREFISSLYNDIRADTSNLVRIISSRARKEVMLDSISYMMNSSSPQKFTKQIYPYAVLASRTRPYRFIATDGTMQQLKNAGGLRLIKNRAIVDSITRYDVNVRNFISQGVVEETILNDYRTTASKIFDATAYYEMLDEEMNLVREPSASPALLPYTNKELYEWNYRIFSMRGINKANMRDAKMLLQQAKNLLKSLEVEYNLK
ncbi:MAG: hypothetical protein ICV66_11650 [Chitinophagaceae bacterium]|nr:hypothetical protein [Chitinophagaceae bacterium]